MLGLFGQRASLRLRRHVDDVALSVELPAMIEAAQAALFVASERERGFAMRTGLAEQAEFSVAVTERNELLAEQLDPHRRAVGAGNLFGQQRGHPVAPHQLAHRGFSFDTAQQLVFHRGQHARSPLKQQGHVARRTGPAQNP